MSLHSISLDCGQIMTAADVGYCDLVPTCAGYSPSQNSDSDSNVILVISQSCSELSAWLVRG